MTNAMLLLRLLFVQIALATSEERFAYAPVVLDKWSDSYGEGGQLLMCMHGKLECQPLCCDVPFDRNWGGDHSCGAFGSHFRSSLYTNCGPYGEGSVGGNVRSRCCECVAEYPPERGGFPIKEAQTWLPSSPNEPGHFEIPQSHPLCDSHHASTCRGFNLTCAPGFQLSQPILQCLHGHSWNDGYQTACGILGMLQSEVYTYSHESAKCRQTGGEYGYPPPSAFCRICEFHLSTTLTTTWWDYSGPSFRELASEDACIPTTTPTTTTTSNLFGTRDWEIVGNGACRGNHSNDNSASYYRVVQLDSLEDCKAECLATFPSCKGIEYSNGRCEIWTRPEGIFAIKNLSGFTCLRFGWPTEYLKPVNGGINRACRGTSGIDNQPHYYRVAKARLLEDCKAQCAAAEVCHGIEFSLGRCEIWQRLPKYTASLEGFSCFSYSPQAQGPLLL